jgi:alkyl hydroperoxide reductase subunit AhpF
MPIISPGNADQVRSYFAQHLQDPVTIRLFTRSRSLLVIPGQRECETCEETEELLREVAALSPSLTLTVHDLRTDPGAGVPYGIEPDLVPAIRLEGKQRGAVRYFGIPAGYEFATLIQDLADVSRGATSLGTDTIAELGALSADVHIRVFVTPT